VHAVRESAETAAILAICLEFTSSSYLESEMLLCPNLAHQVRVLSNEFCRIGIQEHGEPNK
jgi:hypothetical protein